MLAALAGCSEYLDRRETISLSGGNAVATNEVTQMVDPWPRDSANRNIAYNGDEDAKRRRALSHQQGHPAARHRHHPQPTSTAAPRRQQHGAGRTDRGRRRRRNNRNRSTHAHRPQPSPSSNRTRVVVLTADAEFDRSARATFGASSAIDLTVVPGRIAEQGDTLDVDGATVVVVDLDAGRADEMQALARLMARVGAWPPVIAVTQSFDENVARTLLQMRVADFLVKPVAPIDLVRACARVGKGRPAAPSRPRRRSTRSCPRSAAPA